MAETIGSAAAGHPSLNLSSEEKQVYGQLLKEADPDGFGAVSGDVAVRFFEKTKLPPDVLGQIWQIADTENRGFLTPAGFGVVLRLIGHAQAGRVPAATLAAQPAPLPRFDGGAPVLPPATTTSAVTALPAPIQAQYSGTPSSPTQSGPAPIRVPALSPEKVSEYSSLFEKSGAENGALSGLVAKQIFERARLPNEVLGRIWNLADTQGRGYLDVTEFVIAMHLLASYKSGSMRGVPSTLPPGLQDAAARRPPPRMAVPARPGSGTGPPSALQGQFTGYNARPQSPIVRQQAGTPLSTQSTGDGWAISPADKARFDQIFATVDKQGLGYINGEQAVAFFGNARLPEEALAQIWDLADINSEGQLNRDEFAVAMYLIRQQRGTGDGRGNLPTTLPPSLVPPSMRKQVIPPSQPTAPAFENAPITQPRSAAEDLFGLDVMAPSQPPQPTQPAPVQAAQTTGTRDIGPFGSPTSQQVPPAATAAASSIFKPFQPSSSFGQSIIPQSTGSPAPTQAKAAPPPPVDSEDLLGDTDTNVSSKLTNETAELGNLSNQVGTLSKQMTELQGSRSQAEQELSQNSQQKQAFEARLTQLRAAYDKEVQEFKVLQEQLNTSRNENKRLQQDIAMIDGSYSDLKIQHQQLRTAFEADQQENASLKEKIRQTNVDNEQLKPQIEKLKSDARQQKGLVAINKKQLATNELERERIRAEIAAAQKEVDDAIKEAEEISRQVEASKKELEETRAIPKASLPPEQMTAARSPNIALASPTPSTTSNPFMRRDNSSAVFSPPMGSPQPTQDHSAFDSIFGPSYGGASTEAPEVSFRSETPVHHQTASGQGTKHLDTTSPTSSSTAPDIIEPPEPPSSKQITSESLPFRAPLERSESMTSSVKVMPPASRVSPAGTPRATTPSVSTSGGGEHQIMESSIAAAPDEEQESIRQSIPRALRTESAVDVPGAFPKDLSRSHTPAQDVNPTAIAVGAGAAALAVGAGAAAAVTDQHDQPEKEAKPESSSQKVDDATANNFDEFFGGPAHQRTASEQVKDFDDAFANIKSGGPSAANGTSRTATMEFPDIQELEGDDSSVYSEEPAMGFDDNFDTKPNEAAAGQSSTAAGKQPEVATALPSHIKYRPNFENTPSTANSLPGIEQQASPPSYGASVPDDNPSQFPQEYKGLLPERADPTSPTLPTAGSSTNPGPFSSAIPPTYGPEAARNQSEAIEKTRSSSAVKPPAFNFDDAFAGMGAAQVNEDDSDEDEIFNPRQNNAPEFDPTFESPAQSRAPTVASTAQSPITTHDAVTNGTTSNSFYSFYGSATGKAPSQPAVNVPTPAPAPASAVSHDWDSLFAPLSQPSGAEPTGLDMRSNAQTTEISPEITARTSAAEISGSATPIPTTVSAAPPATSTDASRLKVERPQPGRALSTGTEHDDPILKQLTSMGWSRTDSLAALEKYDYNLDKAADYLTFRS